MRRYALYWVPVLVYECKHEHTHTHTHTYSYFVWFLWSDVCNVWCSWQRLQVDRRNFNAYKETVNKMFQMFPKNTEVEPPSRDRCRTCAVVGNSVNLKRSHYGPLIDFQDFVIRYLGWDSGTNINVFYFFILRKSETKSENWRSVFHFKRRWHTPPFNSLGSPRQFCVFHENSHFYSSNELQNE